MIRIYKDKDTKVVTKGAYEAFFKPLGYNVVIEQQEEPKVEKPAKPIVEPKKQEEIVTENKKSAFVKKNKKED